MWRISNCRCVLSTACVLLVECLLDGGLWRECWEASSWNMICRAGMHWGISLSFFLSLSSLCSPGMIERQVRLPLSHWNLFLFLCCCFPIGFVETTLTITLSSQLFWLSECLWGPRLKKVSFNRVWEKGCETHWSVTEKQTKRKRKRQLVEREEKASGTWKIVWFTSDEGQQIKNRT